MITDIIEMRNGHLHLQGNNYNILRPYLGEQQFDQEKMLKADIHRNRFAVQRLRKKMQETDSERKRLQYQAQLRSLTNNLNVLEQML